MSVSENVKIYARSHGCRPPPPLLCCRHGRLARSRGAHHRAPIEMKRCGNVLLPGSTIDTPNQTMQTERRARLPFVAAIVPSDWSGGVIAYWSELKWPGYHTPSIPFQLGFLSISRWFGMRRGVHFTATWSIIEETVAEMEM